MNTISPIRLTITLTPSDSSVNRSGESGISTQASLPSNDMNKSTINFGGASTPSPLSSNAALNQPSLNSPFDQGMGQMGNGDPSSSSTIMQLLQEILKDLLKMLMGQSNQGQQENNEGGEAASPIGTSPTIGASTPTNPPFQNRTHDQGNPFQGGQGQGGLGQGQQHRNQDSDQVPMTQAGNNIGSTPLTTPSITQGSSGPHVDKTPSGDSDKTGLPSSDSPTDQTPSRSSSNGSTPLVTVTPSVPLISGTPSNKPSDKVDGSSPVSGTSNPPTISDAQAGSLEGMEGFAKVAKTTGGQGGEVVNVSTVEELQKSLQGDEPRIIKMANNISADDKTLLKFGANKTLVGGTENNTLHNIYLQSDKGASNDIFQNLNFTHDKRYTANGDIPLYIDQGKGYWIDHNTFSGTKGQGASDPKDKLLYVGGTADFVSLTNSKFQDNHYGLILGYPQNSPEAKKDFTGFPRMTIAHNEFDNLSVRAPGLMRYGKFDVYNNHINDYNLGFTVTGNATIFSQNNVFEKGRDGGNHPTTRDMIDDYGDGHFTDVGSNIKVSNQVSAQSDWTGGNYERNVDSLLDAKLFDEKFSGAQDGTLHFAQTDK